MFDDHMDMLNEGKTKPEISDAQKEKDELIKMIEEASPEKLRAAVLESVEDRKQKDEADTIGVGEYVGNEILIKIFSSTFKILHEGNLQVTISLRKNMQNYDETLYLATIQSVIKKCGLLVIENDRHLSSGLTIETFTISYK
jgi:hypothetical protein